MRTAGEGAACSTEGTGISERDRTRWVASTAELARSALAGSLAACLVGLPLVGVDGLMLSGAVLVIAGGLLGGVLGAAQLSLRVRSRPVRLGLWLLTGTALGVLLAVRLGAFTKLGGPHNTLALVALLGAPLAGLSFGFGLAAVQPDATGASSVGSLRNGPRWLAVSGLAVAALFLSALEATFPLLQLYPDARRALLSGAWSLGFGAARVLLEPRARWDHYQVVSSLVLLGGASAITTALASPSRYGQLSVCGATEQALWLLRALTDFDGDGSSGLFGGGDCAAFDARVWPGAKEIPGNGLDDNCQFGDAKLRAVPLAAAETPPSRVPPPVDVLLLTIDSLRADRTSLFGYVRDTTPSLLAFSRTAVHYRNAFTSGGWTSLAMPSLFSGVYPRRLRWRHYVVQNVNRQPHEPPLVVLSKPTDEDRWTLPGALARRGLFTQAVVHPDAVHFLPVFQRGFQRLDQAPSANDESVTATAIARLREIGAKPFFLWVHYFDPHQPCHHHDGVAGFGDTVSDCYDHEVLATDHAIARLLAAVDEPRARPTVVLIAADHGEIVTEHMQWHGGDLTDASVRVPLLVRAPGLRPRVVSTPASLVDIAPTLLALTETPAPAALDGTDLRTLGGRQRVVFSDLWRHTPDLKPYFDQVSASGERLRLIYDRLRNRSWVTRVGDFAMKPRELPAAAAAGPLQQSLGEYLESSSGGP